MGVLVPDGGEDVLATAVEGAVVVALAMTDVEDDKLVKVMALNVVFLDMAVPVPVLAALPKDVDALVVFIVLVKIIKVVELTCTIPAVGVEPRVMLDEPEPPTRENSPE